MVSDFEFRLENPENRLPADELFYDGKLMPLQLPTLRPETTRSPETPKLRTTEFSSKAPRGSSSRWRELLGWKKLPPNYNENKHEAPKNGKNFLHRSSKSTMDDSSLNLPLLPKDTTHDYSNECLSISSSRLSLSSSSSSTSHEHDDLPRLSLDPDKPIRNPNPPPTRIRLVKHRALSSENPIHRQLAPDSTTTSTLRGLSMDDSPRMNSSGKIIFHNLGTSASSFHGGGSRSYSANVWVTPVLNVPVCSSLRRSSKSGVFGFAHFSSKKDGGTGAVNKKHHRSSRPNRTDGSKEGRGNFIFNFQE